MKKHLSIITIALACVLPLKAQISHTLYNQESVPQITLLNPALQPRCNFFVTIPGANIYTGISDNIRPTEFFKKNGGKWITPLESEFSYSKLRKVYKKKMALDFNTTIGLLNVGWRTSKEGYFTVSINERISTDIALPSDLLMIADKGIPSGTNLNFKRLGINAKVYHEFGVSYTFHYDTQWDFGFRGKLISGISAIKTKNKKFDIHTSADVWTVNSDVEIFTSMPLETDNAIKEDGTIAFDSLDVKDMESSDYKDWLMPNFKNPGFGVDLGASFTLDEYWRFSASVTDLGVIFWKRDLNNIKSNSQFDFDGVYVDIAKINKDEDDARDVLEDELDTLNVKLSPTLNHKKFATGLNPNIYLNAEYRLNHYLTFNFLSHTKFFPKRVNQDFNLAANVNPYKPFSASLGFTLNTQGKFSSNLGFSVRGGFLQFYTMVDYAPYRYNKYNIDGNKFTAPRNMTNLTISAGLNIIFGPHGFRDKPMINAYSNF